MSDHQEHYDQSTNTNEQSRLFMADQSIPVSTNNVINSNNKFYNTNPDITNATIQSNNSQNTPSVTQPTLSISPSQNSCIASSILPPSNLHQQFNGMLSSSSISTYPQYQSKLNSNSFSSINSLSTIPTSFNSLQSSNGILNVQNPIYQISQPGSQQVASPYYYQQQVQPVHLQNQNQIQNQIQNQNQMQEQKQHIQQNYQLPQTYSQSHIIYSQIPSSSVYLQPNQQINKNDIDQDLIYYNNSGVPLNNLTAVTGYPNIAYQRIYMTPEQQQQQHYFNMQQNYINMNNNIPINNGVFNPYNTVNNTNDNFTMPINNSIESSVLSNQNIGFNMMPVMHGLRTAVPWTEEESKLLMKLRERGLTWKEIASNFPNRTLNACQFRWKRISMNGVFENEEENEVKEIKGTEIETETETEIGDRNININGTRNELTSPENINPINEVDNDSSSLINDSKNTYCDRNPVKSEKETKETKEAKEAKEVKNNCSIKNILDTTTETKISDQLNVNKEEVLNLDVKESKKREYSESNDDCNKCNNNNVKEEDVEGIKRMKIDNKPDNISENLRIIGNSNIKNLTKSTNQEIEKKQKIDDIEPETAIVKEEITRKAINSNDQGSSKPVMDVSNLLSKE